MESKRVGRSGRPKRDLVRDWAAEVRNYGYRAGAVADARGVTRSTLRRYLLRHRQQNPRAYADTLRMDDGLGFMKAGLSVKEVAAKLGYADQAHFCRHFKTGVWGSADRIQEADEGWGGRSTTNGPEFTLMLPGSPIYSDLLRSGRVDSLAWLGEEEGRVKRRESKNLCGNRREYVERSATTNSDREKKLLLFLHDWLRLSTTDCDWRRNHCANCHDFGALPVLSHIPDGPLVMSNRSGRKDYIRPTPS